MIAAALCVVLAALVLALLAQSSRRRRAEQALCTTEAELHSSTCEAQVLAGRLITEQESERRRIARDLHDNLCQKLSLLCIDIDSLRRCETATPVVARAAAHLSERAVDILGDVRRLSHDLHPPSLEILGLAPAIDRLCRDLSCRYGVRITFEDRAMDRRLPVDASALSFSDHAAGLTERRQPQRRSIRECPPCPGTA